jgi:hypothetical protein
MIIISDSRLVVDRMVMVDYALEETGYQPVSASTSSAMTLFHVLPWLSICAQDLPRANVNAHSLIVPSALCEMI